MIRLKSLAAPIGIAIVSLLASTPGLSDSAVSTRIGQGGIEWWTTKSHGGANLSIVGPDGFQYSERAKSVNGLHFSRFEKDGLYKYEITLEPRIKRTRPENDNVARMSKREAASKVSGTFRIVNGEPVDPGVKE